MAAPKDTAIRLDDILSLAPPFPLASVGTAPRVLLIAGRDGGVMILGRPDPDAVAADDPDSHQPP